MPTYKGSIEHLFAVIPKISGTIQAMFKVTYDFLNSGSDLGIQRLAYNTGTRPSDCGQTGTNFYDQNQPFGDNSWACFRFASASVPFDILIQYSGTGVTFGNTTNDHAKIGGSAAASQNNFGIAVATAFSGSTAIDPWNGTTTLSGSDRKGTAVWTSGSATNRLSVFPRSNAFGGSFVTTNDDMVAFVFQFSTSAPHRYQIVASKDSIYIARDQWDDSAYDKFFYAGSYNPISGSSPTVPFVVWSPLTTNETAGTQIPATTVGTSYSTDGGIAHPLFVDTKFLSIDRLSYFNQTTALQPNNSFSPTQYDEFPIYVGMNETTSSYGICGTLDFVREIYKTNVHDINNVTQRAVLGSDSSVSSIKHSIPWVSGTTPGTGTTRAGVQFSRLHGSNQFKFCRYTRHSARA